MRTPAAALALALALLAPFTASLSASAACVDYLDYLHWRGGIALSWSPMGLAVSGSHAYVACYDQGVYVVDVSDPDAPSIAGHVDVPGYTSGVAVHGDLAVVTGAIYESGYVSIIHAIDISDPSNPLVVGELRLAGDGAGSPVIVGDLAFFAAGGLQVVDIHAPDSLRLVGSLNMPVPDYRVSGLDVSGSHAYVAYYTRWASGGLRVVDVTNPAEPVLATELDTGATHDVAVQGDRAYVGGGRSLYVVDIEDPLEPHILGSLPDWGGGFWGLVLSPTHVFSCHGSTVVSPVVAIDITDPANPRLDGSLPAAAAGLAISGGRLFATIEDYGLRIIDIASPVSPEVTTLSMSAPLEIAVRENCVYAVQGGEGVQVVDVTDPESPRLAGHVDTPDYAMDVALSADGRYAYVADWTSLQVLDVGDPDHPTITWQTAWVASQLAVSGNHAYVADSTGVQVFSLANPRYPGRISRVELSNYVGDLAVQGAYLYALRDNDLVVINVLNPSFPLIDAVLHLPVWGSIRLALFEDCAYVAAQAGLQVVDISEPRQPRLGATLPVGGFAVAVGEGFLYAAPSLGGLDVLVCAGPAAPRFLGGVWTSAVGYDAVISGSYVYCGGGSGLQIVPAQCNTSAVASISLAGSQAGLEVLPNPSAGQASLRFDLTRPGRVRSGIYDLTGRQVRNLPGEFLDTGTQELRWDGRDSDGRRVAPGIYFARVSTPEGVRTARFVIVP